MFVIQLELELGFLSSGPLSVVTERHCERVNGWTDVVAAGRWRTESRQIGREGRIEGCVGEIPRREEVVVVVEERQIVSRLLFRPI